MRRFVVPVIALFVSAGAFAQKFVPQIGIGTVFNYNVVATSTGQQVPLTLSIVSLNDPMKLTWVLPGVGTGNFLIPKQALESGQKMRLEEPSPNVDTKFKDNETIMFISKAEFNDMLKTQEFTISHLKFKIDPTPVPYLINGKDVDTYHAHTANSSVEIWVLNDPDFPVICKLAGNPSGIDFDLRSIKE